MSVVYLEQHKWAFRQPLYVPWVQYYLYHTYKEMIYKITESYCLLSTWYMAGTLRGLYSLTLFVHQCSEGGIVNFLILQMRKLRLSEVNTKLQLFVSYPSTWKMMVLSLILEQGHNAFWDSKVNLIRKQLCYYQISKKCLKGLPWNLCQVCLQKLPQDKRTNNP